MQEKQLQCVRLLKKTTSVDASTSSSLRPDSFLLKRARKENASTPIHQHLSEDRDEKKMVT